MTSTTANSIPALSAEDIQARATRNGEPEFLARRRLAALEHYHATPLPGRRDEIWRRVDLGRLDLEAATVRSAAEDLVVLGPLAGTDGTLWSSTGVALRARPELFKKYWNTEVFPVGAAEGALSTGGKFHALNQALWEDGYVLHVPAGISLEAPAQAILRPRSGKDGFYPHNLIVLEENSTATVVEAYVPGGPTQEGLCCPQTEVILGRGATLCYILIQNTGPQMTYIGTHRVNQYGGSKLNFISAHLGGALSKTFLGTCLLEAHAAATLSGVYYGTGTQRLHMDTLQQHVAPQCTSDLLFKGVLDEKARAVYRGMIRLELTAQKTDAYQKDRTLLLSDDARMDSIPALEILANDVRCSHGATAGQVDPEMLFYLRSRGLSLFQARSMILAGFFEDILLRCGNEALSAPIRRELERKIGD